MRFRNCASTNIYVMKTKQADRFTECRHFVAKFVRCAWQSKNHTPNGDKDSRGPSVRLNPQHRSFDCCLSHFRTSVSTSSSSAKRLPPSCEPLYATDTSHRKQETFLMNILCIKSFCPQKSITERFSSVVHSSTVANLTTETSLWTCACVSAT
jgi:hypothetical protein